MMKASGGRVVPRAASKQAQGEKYGGAEVGRLDSFRQTFGAAP